MEVRLLSVGTRGFFLVASRLAIAAQFCRPQREKNLWHQGNSIAVAFKNTKSAGRAKERDQINNKARLFWKSILKTKHKA